MPEQHPTSQSNAVPHPAEGFRNVPNASASFGTVPQPSETFRNVPNPAEKTDDHTLTVREVARLFETAGVARTERSIVNWCQRNAQGIARLDAYFDPNERKYFITAGSVHRAIEEEKSRASKTADPLPNPAETSTEKSSTNKPSSSEPVGNLRKDSASRRSHDPEDADHLAELELKLRDLEITNRVKDQVIEMKDKEIDRLGETQRRYIERLIDSSHQIGQLETQLKQLEAPAEPRVRRLEVRNESADVDS